MGDLTIKNSLLKQTVCQDGYYWHEGGDSLQLVGGTVYVQDCQTDGSAQVFALQLESPDCVAQKGIFSCLEPSLIYQRGRWLASSQISDTWESFVSGQSRLSPVFAPTTPEEMRKFRFFISNSKDEPAQALVNGALLAAAVARKNPVTALLGVSVFNFLEQKLAPIEVTPITVERATNRFDQEKRSFYMGDGDPEEQLKTARLLIGNPSPDRTTHAPNRFEEVVWSDILKIKEQEKRLAFLVHLRAFWVGIGLPTQPLDQQIFLLERAMAKSNASPHDIRSSGKDSDSENCSIPDLPNPPEKETETAPPEGMIYSLDFFRNGRTSLASASSHFKGTMGKDISSLEGTPFALLTNILATLQKELEIFNISLRITFAKKSDPAPFRIPKPKLVLIKEGEEIGTSKDEERVTGEVQILWLSVGTIPLVEIRMIRVEPMGDEIGPSQFQVEGILVGKTFVYETSLDLGRQTANLPKMRDLFIHNLFSNDFVHFANQESFTTLLNHRRYLNKLFEELQAILSKGLYVDLSYGIGFSTLTISRGDEEFDSAIILEIPHDNREILLFQEGYDPKHGRRLEVEIGRLTNGEGEAPISLSSPEVREKLKSIRLMDGTVVFTTPRE